MNLGYFITFEGGEGIGKTTQVSMLNGYLKESGYAVKSVREPGQTDLGLRIRELLLHTDLKINERAEALLFEAARAALVDEIIQPHLNDNEIVISDRFFDSTTAYQGYARGLNITQLYALNDFATNGLVPNLTFLIDINPELGLSKLVAEREGPDRFEREKLEFHEKVRQGFLAIARNNPNRFVVVDYIESGINKMQDLIRSEVYERISKRSLKRT